MKAGASYISKYPSTYLLHPFCVFPFDSVGIEACCFSHHAPVLCRPLSFEMWCNICVGAGEALCCVCFSSRGWSNADDKGVWQRFCSVGWALGPLGGANELRACSSRCSFAFFSLSSCLTWDLRLLPISRCLSFVPSFRSFTLPHLTSLTFSSLQPLLKREAVAVTPCTRSLIRRDTNSTHLHSNTSPRPRAQPSTMDSTEVRTHVPPPSTWSTRTTHHDT